MEQLKSPNGLKLDGNLSMNLTKFLQRFKLCLVATGANEKSDAVQTLVFLHVIGEQALEIYNTFKFDNEGDELKLELVKKKFTECCHPRKNLTYERHIFFPRWQQEGESIDYYVTDLKNKSKTCEFGTLEESLITDRIVCGVRNAGICEQLLHEPMLTLVKAVDVCQAFQMSKTQLKNLQKSGEEEGAACNAIGRRKTAKQGKFSPSQNTKPSSTKQNETDKSKNNCKKCSYQYEPRRCPAYGKTCEMQKAKSFPQNVPN